ncbi:MAG: hypothetical protein B5766_07345 [Candidatus Lumbricidophila eiseniae]|uniref:HTH cro/C1-type domain-containing protein n=1 Tax=Candidatus Lumbricidiphila eiseniae TaxID=1969409 RepID=A0A2A6FQX4_9MICO|nr:MAG: hypothetical protein B5766_07345 [Candidatus Lumbricidophila eiseniae]
MSSTTSLTARLVGGIKAELARRDLNGHDLVAPLGLGRNAVYARLRGDRPFDVVEIEKIATFLGVDPLAFFEMPGVPTRASESEEVAA